MSCGDVGEGRTMSPQPAGLLLPPPGYSRGGCVALATGSAMGLWEVKNCTAFRARYICRQSLGTPVTPELPGPDPTPSLTGSCPQGWGSDPKLRHCYKVGSLLTRDEGEELEQRNSSPGSRAAPVRPSHDPGGWAPGTLFLHSGPQTEVISDDTLVSGISALIHCRCLTNGKN